MTRKLFAVFPIIALCASATLFAFPQKAHAALPLVVATSAGATSFSGSLTYSHNVPATSTNRLLVVSVGLSQADDCGSGLEDLATSVTFKGVNLTRASRICQTNDANSMDQWYLVNPPTGPGSVIISFGGTPNMIHSTATSLAGVNQRVPIAFTYASSSQTHTTAKSFTFPSAPGLLVIDSFCAGSAISSSGQTTRIIHNVTDSDSCDNDAMSTKSGAFSTTMSWTISIGDINAYSALSIRPIGTLVKPANNLGLVGYWPFDEGTTTSAGDFSGNGNTGTLTSSPTWINGKRGKALSFDGSGARVDIAENSNLPMYSNTAHTFSAWVKGAPQSTKEIFGEESSTGGSAEFAIAGNSGGGGPSKLEIVIVNDAGTSVKDTVTNTTVLDNTWHHVVWTDNNGAGKIYVDGQQDSADFSYTRTGAFTTLNKTLLGADHNGNFAFTGQIDDVRIYNRALSASEVAALYAGGTAGAARVNASSVTLQNGTTLGPANGLVGLWTFDGADVSDKVYDRSGQNNNGYFTIGATSSVKTIGKLGQALNFRGNTDESVNMPTTAAVADNLSAMTVSTWFKTTNSGNTILVSKIVSVASSPGWMVVENPNGSLSGKIGFYTQQDGSNWNGKYTNARYDDGLWHHLAATLSGGGGGTITIYIDGQSVATTNDTSGTVSTYSTSEIIRVGNQQGGNLPFVGTLDDVRIYNRALSAAEAMQLYKLGVATIKQ